MTHWGWYWKIKKQHKPRTLCSSPKLHELDSFAMFNNYQQIESVRLSSTQLSLYIPQYDLHAYLQDDDSLLVKYQGGSYIIPVEQKTCNFGGHYYFFHCPLCNKRIRKLYCLKGQYQCRKCGNLAYYKQRLRPFERFTSMHLDIRDYVKNRGGNLKTNRKPPRMHNKTFQKLKTKAAYLNARSTQAIYKDLRQWYGAKAEPWLDGYLEYEATCIVNEYKGKELPDSI